MLEAQGHRDGTCGGTGLVTGQRQVLRELAQVPGKLP